MTSTIYINTLIQKQFLFKTCFTVIDIDAILEANEILTKFDKNEYYIDIVDYGYTERIILTNNQKLHNLLKEISNCNRIYEPKTHIHEKYIKEGYIITSWKMYKYLLYFKPTFEVQEFLLCYNCINESM